MPQTYDYWDGSQNDAKAPVEKDGSSAQPGDQSVADQQSRVSQDVPIGQANQVSGGSSQQLNAQYQQQSAQSQRQAAAQPQQQAAYAQASYQAAPAQAQYQAPAQAQYQAPAQVQYQAPPQTQYQAAPAAMPQQIAYVAVPQKKGKGWIVALVAVLCFFALAAFGVKSCSDAMANGGAYGASLSPSGDTVAVIEVDGTIQYDGTACSPEGFKTLLDRAANNSNIKAVVLRVNSGGGTATAGEEMAEYLRDFEKPVVVSSASLNASAAYEISAQADYIYVAKSTEIGAIGTAMQVTDMSGLLDMLGINVDVITSADSKDSSYGYRPLSDEEREYYQHMIDQINDMFIENVAEGRNMSTEEVRKLATGLSFTGVDAVGNGLADEVGTLEDAKDKAAELAGISSYDSYDLYLSNYDLSGLYGLLGSEQKSFTLDIPGMKQTITVQVSE